MGVYCSLRLGRWKHGAAICFVLFSGLLQWRWRCVATDQLGERRTGYSSFIYRIICTGFSSAEYAVQRLQYIATSCFNAVVLFVALFFLSVDVC